MKALRIFEAISAVLASLLGMVPVAVLLLFVAVLRGRRQVCQPIHPGGPINCTYIPGPTTLETQGLSVALPILACAVIVAGIGIAGVWHSRKSGAGAWTLLWIFAAALALITFTNLNGGMGSYLLPSVVCAALACVFSFGNRRPASVLQEQSRA